MKCSNTQYKHSAFVQSAVFSGSTVGRTKTPKIDLLLPFYGYYRTNCISRHPWLRTRGFYWSKVLLPACPYWWQLARLDYGEDARVLLNSVICTVSVPFPPKQILWRRFKQVFNAPHALPVTQPTVSKHWLGFDAWC